MTNRSSVASRILGAVETLLGGGESLENINTTTLDDGCFCFVIAEEKHYELHRTDTASPNPPLVIKPIAGPGRWVPAAGGATGAQGAQGAQGSTGAQGAQGAIGAQGSQGAQGAPASLPAVSATDNGDQLTVVAGAWAKAANGFLGFATTALRDSFPGARTAGMLSYVSTTQCLYMLAEDLTTWDFFAPSPALARQAAWAIGGAGASDNNSGLPGFPLATTEEVSRRLCPGGQKIILQQSTTITLAAGTQTELDLYVDWPASFGFQSAALIVVGNVTSSAPTTITVIDTVTGTTRGQVTTSGLALTARKRIRSTSGAHIGAICFSTGQNASAQNHFVSQWTNYNESAVVNVASGTTAVVDDLNTTLKMCRVRAAGGGGYIQIQDLIITDVRSLNETPYPNAIFFWGCDAAGAGNGIWEALGPGSALWSCRIISPTYFAGLLWYVEGCAIQSTYFVYLRGSESRFVFGCCVDGSAGVTCIDVQRGLVRLQSGPVEFVNGGANTAIVVETAGVLDDIVGAALWGLSTPFATGISVASGAAVNLAAAANVSFPSTANYSLSGTTIAYAGVPAAKARAGCSITINPDPGAAVTTT